MFDRAVVHLIDDDAEALTALSTLMGSVGLTTRCYSSADKFYTLYDATVPGCIIMDVCMPGMDGLLLFEHLIARRINIPVIILTAHADVAMAVQAMSNGAFGFLEKPPRSLELIDLVKRALESDLRCRRQLLERERVDILFRRLSGRECDVLRMVTQGAPNKAIALRLSISERTVEQHRAHLMEKLEVGSLAQLVRLTVEYERVQSCAQPSHHSSTPETLPRKIS